MYILFVLVKTLEIQSLFINEFKCIERKEVKKVFLRYLKKLWIHFGCMYHDNPMIHQNKYNAKEQICLQLNFMKCRQLTSIKTT